MLYDVTLQTISWINSLNNSETLEISPDFQRRAVWLEDERASLIDTILLQLPFPEVYFQIQVDVEDGSENYIVVDGQQRVTSILKFINNEFQTKRESKYFRDLATEQKELFWNYKIVVRMLRNTNESEIRDIFQKLNTNNIALNDQELRNAKYIGRFKQLSEKLSDTEFFQSLGLFSARDIRRMIDIEFVSELLLQIIYGVTNKKDLLDTAYIKFEEDLPDEIQIERTFNDIISAIKLLINDDNKSLIKTKSNFYSLFGAILEYKKQSSCNFLPNESNITLLTDFLILVRDEGEAANDPKVREYSESYSRAASDKARRVKRQEILLEIIR